jgi:SNF2 family DNA or RNA helicase
VGINDDELWFAESQLKLLPIADLPRWQNKEAFLRDLLLTKLKCPLVDNLYSYGASRTFFLPYQFKPVLKFLRNPEQRILIADEVGLGKTIEAALIYLELKARTDLSRVLILCPSRLKSKWKDEMRNRFQEDLTDLDSSGVRKILDDHRRYGPQFPFRAIASFETMRRAEFIDEFTNNQMPIDLLIVDEAHHMRNDNTLTHRLGEVLADMADAVVFLTATPLHLGNSNLYNLLHILSPGEFDDPKLFDEQVRPNTHINVAARHLESGNSERALEELRHVESTMFRDRFINNPYYTEVIRRLRIGVQTTQERIGLQRDLIDLNTLSTIFTRTRKREVEKAAFRAPFTIEVQLSPRRKLSMRASSDMCGTNLATRSEAHPHSQS